MIIVAQLSMHNVSNILVRRDWQESVYDGILLCRLKSILSLVVIQLWFDFYNFSLSIRAFLFFNEVGFFEYSCIVGNCVKAFSITYHQEDWCRIHQALLSGLCLIRYMSLAQRDNVLFGKTIKIYFNFNDWIFHAQDFKSCWIFPSLSVLQISGATLI